MVPLTKETMSYFKKVKDAPGFILCAVSTTGEFQVQYFSLESKAWYDIFRKQSPIETIAGHHIQMIGSKIICIISSAGKKNCLVYNTKSQECHLLKASSVLNKFHDNDSVYSLFAKIFIRDHDSFIWHHLHPDNRLELLHLHKGVKTTVINEFAWFNMPTEQLYNDPHTLPSQRVPGTVGMFIMMGQAAYFCIDFVSKTISRIHNPVKAKTKKVKYIIRDSEDYNGSAKFIAPSSGCKMEMISLDMCFRNRFFVEQFEEDEKVTIHSSTATFKLSKCVLCARAPFLYSLLENNSLEQTKKGYSEIAVNELIKFLRSEAMVFTSPIEEVKKLVEFSKLNSTKPIAPITNPANLLSEIIISSYEGQMLETELFLETHVSHAFSFYLKAAKAFHANNQQLAVAVDFAWKALEQEPINNQYLNFVRLLHELILQDVQKFSKAEIGLIEKTLYSPAEWQFVALLYNKMNHDVKLQLADGTIFYVHKCFLQYKSEFFVKVLSMLQDNDKSVQTINLQHMNINYDRAVIDAVLRFAYSRVTKVIYLITDEKHLMQLIAAAHTFGYKQLVEACEEHFCTSFLSKFESAQLTYLAEFAASHQCEKLLKSIPESAYPEQLKKKKNAPATPQEDAVPVAPLKSTPLPILALDDAVALDANSFKLVDARVGSKGSVWLEDAISTLENFEVNFTLDLKNRNPSWQQAQNDKKPLMVTLTAQSADSVHSFNYDKAGDSSDSVFLMNMKFEGISLSKINLSIQNPSNESVSITNRFCSIDQPVSVSLFCVETAPGSKKFYFGCKFVQNSKLVASGAMSLNSNWLAKSCSGSSFIGLIASMGNDFAQVNVPQLHFYNMKDDVQRQAELVAWVESDCVLKCAVSVDIENNVPVLCGTEFTMKELALNSAQPGKCGGKHVMKYKVITKKYNC